MLEFHYQNSLYKIAITYNYYMFNLVVFMTIDMGQLIKVFKVLVAFQLFLSCMLVVFSQTIVAL